MDLGETEWGGMDLIEDRDQWRGFVNTVLKFLVP
jgi:hypothetical protein